MHTRTLGQGLRVSAIGLGAMGRPMARRLAAAGSRRRGRPGVPAAGHVRAGGVGAGGVRAAGIRAGCERVRACGHRPRS